MVHHRYVARLRPRVDDGGAGARRPRRRDGARPAHARRPRGEHGDALLPLRARRHRPRARSFDAVRRAHEHFGRLDIVVNNAGYGQFGMVEELTEAGGARADRDQPVRRAVGHPGGAAVPARAGQRPHHPGLLDRRHHRVPGLGIYHASKWALEGISQALAQEVAGFGIHVTLVEPGGFSTDWGGPSAKHAEPLPPTRHARGVAGSAAHAARRAGDPTAIGRGRDPRSSTPTSRRCASSSAARRSASPSRTTRAASRPGASGSRSPSWRRADRPRQGARGRSGSWCTVYVECRPAPAAPAARAARSAPS